MKTDFLTILEIASHYLTRGTLQLIGINARVMSSSTILCNREQWSKAYCCDNALFSNGVDIRRPHVILCREMKLTGDKCLESLIFLFDCLIKLFDTAFCACAIILLFYSCSCWSDAILRFKYVNIRTRSNPKFFALKTSPGHGLTMQEGDSSTNQPPIL